jgi:hypothetical protein
MMCKHEIGRFYLSKLQLTGLQINLYLGQPVAIQLFATFFQRRKSHKKRLTF